MGRSSLYPTTTLSLPSPIKPSPNSISDPILPYLQSISSELGELERNPDGPDQKLKALLEDCVQRFSDDRWYQNDVRFLKIWVLYGDAIQDFKRVFRMMEVKRICQKHSLLYEAYAIFLVAKGNLVEANEVYELGISRKAEPLDRLKKMHVLFLEQMSELAQKPVPETKIDRTGIERREQVSIVDPWSISTRNDILKKIDAQMRKYNGYHKSSKVYAGKVSLNSLNNSSRNKIIELGGCKYQIRGCSGLGGFAQVFKAFINSNPDDVVALKIQKPAFPWEFYIYRLLDKRIPEMERASFGFAHKVHIYPDISILVCNYLSHGTLQDAINSHLLLHKFMDEILCIYYTIEMLRMLETLHAVGIIHGDFKPDNLLIRYSRDDPTEDGPWRDQGLCLVDWGKGIDTSLFPANTEFNGDCKTSGFQCVQMQENRTWTYQVDTYGLCVNVHMMLHGQYMSIEKKITADGSYIYQPKLPFKRYWKTDLWKNLFSTLLNVQTNQSDVQLLRNLRKSFEDYLYNNRQLMQNLKKLLMKQKASLCSS
ncbi:uncharacterized protein A4U43_C03F11580 [Asparagus officinalis]|uniref:Mitotic checkpoint serine/threonine-protein kinase BUB1 n=1 Tax=Asparagus officinalis TaxID=4686 RepID=A0A5P1FE72_ASPOF|nr:mitotic checkpoint serine/threonine-protein kinase BUB1 [Asparagus officinalis]ONK74931.1 uncharacterized protein A4U43_C03F11580 [Asparagus officinalis]